MTTIENLPGEALSNIFIRLLSKQLAQMRSVCKPWNALLSDSSFIKSHLNHSIQNNNNDDDILMFFGTVFSFELSPTPFTVRLSRSPHLELDNFIKLPVIPKGLFGCGGVIGSVNGLICFYYLSNVDHGYLIHIWNPSLSAVLSLPPSPCLPRELHFGFGFDPKTDDYKVLRVTASEVGPQTEVYSMRKGSWKLISRKLPSIIKILAGQTQVCVEDHLLWLGSIDLEWTALLIVGFDLGEETYFVMPLPLSLTRHREDRSNVLGVLSGKVCVMSCVEGGECEVWVMDEYQVPESWVKHQVFPPFSGDIVPFGFTSHGEFFFQVDQDKDRFGLYDPIAAKSKTFKIVSSYCSVSKVVEYVDSLVWIQPPKCESSSCDISQLQIGE